MGLFQVLNLNYYYSFKYKNRFCRNRFPIQKKYEKTQKCISTFFRCFLSVFLIIKTSLKNFENSPECTTTLNSPSETILDVKTFLDRKPKSCP